MPQLSLGAWSRISWDRDTLVVVFSTYYEMLEFWIEYIYLPGTKMPCCSIRASRALMIGPKYVPSEVVVCCLSIAQHAPVLEHEPQSIPQVRSCGWTVLKFGFSPVVDLLIVGYLLKELIASRLLRSTTLILQSSLFRSHQGLTCNIG
jgi:hypothetical protein